MNNTTKSGGTLQEPTGTDVALMALLTARPLTGFARFVNPVINPACSDAVFQWLATEDAPANVYRDASGGLYVGFLDVDGEGSWLGARLMDIVQVGQEAATLVVTKAICSEWEEITVAFWRTYLREGVTALDRGAY